MDAEGQFDLAGAGDAWTQSTTAVRGLSTLETKL
jgi:hypothetical protein